MVWGQVWSPNNVTNNITRAKAIQVASKLKVEMYAPDVRRFLSRHSLTNCAREFVGDEINDFYTLSDGSSLWLIFAPSWSRDPLGGLLERAVIQSNGVYLVSITLTNGP